MRLTLIQQNKVHFLALPAEVSGSYIMPYSKLDGSEEALLSIRPEKDKWFAECGMNAYVTVGGKNYRGCSVERAGLSFAILIRTTGETALLFTENDGAEMRRFRKYWVSGRILIGRNSDCDIVLNNAEAAPYCAEIIADDKSMTLRAIENSFVFVNSLRAAERALVPGDVVFISGCTIICGQRIIAVDKAPIVSIRQGAVISEYRRPPEETGEMSYCFDDVKSEKFIYVAPRFIKKYPAEEIKILPPPNGRLDNAQPAALSLGPAFTMGIASATTGAFTVFNSMNQGAEITSIMPTLVMTGSMVASSMLWPIISKSYTKHKSRRDERRRKSVYLHYLQDTEKKITDGMSEQLEILEENNPDISRLRDRIRLGASSLWERSEGDEDFLSVCVGLGDVAFASEIKADLPAMEVNPDILFDEMRKVVSKKHTISNAPVILNLRRDYVCGISGDRAGAVALAQGIILQLAALYSYKELKIAVIYDENEEYFWSGARWLPHTWDDKRETRYIAANAEEMNALSSALEAELAEQGGSSGKSATAAELAGRHFVIVCASRTLAQKTALLTHIIQKNRYAGFSFIAVYSEDRLLPKDSTAVMRFCGEKETRDRTDSPERSLMYKSKNVSAPQMLKPMTVPLNEFVESSVALADKRLGTEESGYDMPDMLTFLDMYGVKTIEELNCMQRWQKNSSVRSLAAPLGVDSRGDLFNLDLHQKAHGPHGLIAGTTGSGKSEFIMTMILSLAVNYSPHDISFLLIDYKGGGMAVAFEKLPHVAGIITNLDGAAVNRSLISIQSELKRRQALFLEAGKKLGTNIGDIYKYQKLYKEGRLSRPLQHLYIISDEFAELKSQQPDFMTELISAARIGRSLGVHLILATQKPSGVVNDQIWSNSRFKICLKVQDRTDSMDVIKCPDAAAITQTGRFYMQVGYNEIFELGQSAWAGAKYDPAAENSSKIDDSIEIIDNAGRVIMQAENEMRRKLQVKTPAAEKEHDTQLQEITKYLTELCISENLRADLLWLDPIPGKIYVDELEKKYNFTAQKGRLEVVIGEYDVPQRQEQRLLTLAPADGNIMVYGSAGNGKTTFLTAYIYGMLRRYSAKESVIYIIDFSSETLRAFSDYDAVGAVCTGQEPDRIRNLFSFLMSEAAKRKEIFSAQGGDFASYCRNNDDMPAIQLVIANIGAFCESMDFDEQLEYIAKEGSKLGIYVIASQLNATVKHRLAQNFGKVFCMQLNNGDYCDVISSVGRMVPAKFKGRGLFKHEFVSEFQTAYITDEPDVFEFIRKRSAEINESHGHVKAREIRMLPKVVTPEAAAALTADSMHPIAALDRTNTEPVALNLTMRMNIFVSQTADESIIAEGVCSVVAASHRTYVFDAAGELNLDGIGAEYFSDDNIADGIRQLFAQARERNLRAKALDDAGEKVDFSDDQIVCVITGLNRLLADYRKLSEQERISEDTRIIEAQKAGSTEKIIPVKTMRDNERMLTLLLTGGAHDFGISFVIFERSSKLLELRQSKWFTQHIRLKNYFWIGAGLGMESGYQHQAISDGRFDYGDDLGWSVVGGRASMVRFVSTLEEL